jgi:hypothetical protein
MIAGTAGVGAALEVRPRNNGVVNPGPEGDGDALAQGPLEMQLPRGGLEMQLPRGGWRCSCPGGDWRCSCPGGPGDAVPLPRHRLIFFAGPLQLGASVRGYPPGCVKPYTTTAGLERKVLSDALCHTALYCRCDPFPFLLPSNSFRVSVSPTCARPATSPRSSRSNRTCYGLIAAPSGDVSPNACRGACCAQGDMVYGVWECQLVKKF